MVGDVFRRLVARTLAPATAPPRGGLPNTGVRLQTKVTDRGPRRNPEENCAAAQATVRRLEVASVDPGFIGEGTCSTLDSASAPAHAVDGNGQNDDESTKLTQQS